MKKLFITLLILTLTLTGMGANTVIAKAATLPKLQMVTQPATEYKDGDRVSFTVNCPNYSGLVQYRVILYNGTTKKTSELWNTPLTGYYYTGWMPSGTTKFTINWPVKGMEPGAYSLTVLVRRVGSKAAYDSYVKTSTFWVKPKRVVDAKFIGDGTEKRVNDITVEPHEAYNINPNCTKLYLFRGFGAAENIAGVEPISIQLQRIADSKTLMHIYNEGKDYVVYFGSKRNTENALDVMDTQGLFNTDNPHRFEVYLYEVFYDTKADKYYLANEQHTEFMSAVIKNNVEHTAGEMPKYIAIPVAIADFK